jgi:endoplasmic reticulum chaperone BiP
MYSDCFHSLISILILTNITKHRFEDAKVQRDMKLLPFKIINKGGKAYVEVKVKGDDKVYTPEEISAMISGR